jgi:hypothetical protein
MHRSDQVVFISAGMNAPKKRDHILARRQLYLNYGALTLATQLEGEGYRTVLVHGGHEDPASFLEELFSQGLLPSAHPLMLSVPSFYALSWAQDFCRLLKARDPECRIVVGGRWVVGPDPEWFRIKVPEVDIVSPGLGEAVIGDLIRGRSAIITASQDTGLPAFALNHRLVRDYRTYQPSLEISRGCGMRCAFCEERDIPLSKLRDPALMADHMAQTVDQYGGGEIRPYLEASFFLPTVRWARQFGKEMNRRGLDIRWRCETRVDAMKPDTVSALAAAGLKVLDLGLESASAQQVSAMRKANDPDPYLRRASDLLTACKANGVWVKVNILLYAGETAKTVEETRAWLDQHADAIKGVSVGPVIAFGPPRQSTPLLREFEGLGGRAVDNSSAERSGITFIHPSPEMNSEEAEAISLNLSRRYMNANDYFDLKVFSYYPRGYDRLAFDKDVAASDSSSLPFTLTDAHPFAGAG